MAKAVKPAKAEEKQTYEQALSALEDVVAKMERGDGTLEEMIALYERGMGFVAMCNERLDAYESRIQKLAGLSEEAHSDAD